MTCLIIIHDLEDSFLIDLTSSITGYVVQRQDVDQGQICQDTIIPCERKSIENFDFSSITSKNCNRVAVLKVGLRCLDNTDRDKSWAELDELLDHEYLFFRGKLQRKDFCRFLSFVTGQHNALDQIKKKERSTYIGLTYPNVQVALSNMTIVSVGADALELRVDLLHEEDQAGIFPSLEYVERQMTLLRLHSELPIIFTIRLEPSAGRWPLNSTDLAVQYLLKALKLGVEFIDMEDHFDSAQRELVLSRRGHTAVIASHHDFSGLLDWNSPNLHNTYNDCASFGDVVQIAGIAAGLNDTFEIQKFRSKVQLGDGSRNPPLSAFNTGRGGKLSRILNPFLEATTHPLLPVSSAPNQLSLVEANGVLSVLGELVPKNILLFQDPAPDDAIMEKCFNELNLPHTAVRVAQGKRQDIVASLRNSDCSGAIFSSSSPLIDRLVLDSHSPEALLTRSVDTISAENGRLTGHSCLAIGIESLLIQGHSPSAFQDKNMLVIGRAFSEASPVIAALISLGCGQIFTLGFSIPPEVNCRNTTCTVAGFEEAIHSVGIFSTLPIGHRSFLAPLLHLIEKKNATGKARSIVFLDLHGSQRDAEAAVARHAGWCTVLKENIQAAVLAARLRILVDQSIPYDFIRMVRRQQLY